MVAVPSQVIAVLLVASLAVAAPSPKNAPPARRDNATDIQSSLCLDPSQVQDGLFQTGQGATPDPGQVASLISHNNFINFCATRPELALTNGLQVRSGSCNPTPMGIIASTTKMPNSKFVFPTNFGTIGTGSFTIRMAINNIETGNFVNPLTNYYAAPQHTTSDGTIIGHSHCVVQLLASFNSTVPLDPNVFAFFKGMNTKAVNGELTADVTDGLPPGFYRLASINAAANHMPVLVATAQHGSLDDAIYFEVKDGAGGTTPVPPSASASSVSSSSKVSPSATKVNQVAAAAVTSSSQTSAAATTATTADKGGHRGGKGKKFRGSHGRGRHH